MPESDEDREAREARDKALQDSNAAYKRMAKALRKDDDTPQDD